MPYAHKRRDEDGVELHERSTDSDRWARFGEIVEHYKLAWAFWIIVASAAGWFSNQVVQPLKDIPTIKATQDTLARQLKEAEADRTDIKNVLKIAIKMLCAQTSAADRFKYGIDCAQIPLPELGSTSLTKPTP